MILCAFAINKLSSGNNNVEKANINDGKIIEANSIVKIYDEDDYTTKEKSFKLSFLGEIMMGGKTGETLGYNYKSAFKTISEYTKKSDYTVVNMGTNIIDLKTITNSKSDYIVTKNILSAFNALGIDGVNIANDHIMDFDKSVLKDTKAYLQEDYDIIGLKNTITYAEHDGIKVAIIGVCNEVIGNEYKYTDAGIMMYNLKTLKNMIKEAKKKANTVILLTHLGLQNTYDITNVMAWFYRELVDYGADIVLGDHALGIYPIEIYKGRPIIYSMGYLFKNTEYKEEKETGIFNIYVDKDGKLMSLEIIPLYINGDRQTILYSDFSKEGCKNLLNTLTQKLDNSMFKIANNFLLVDFNK